MKISEITDDLFDGALCSIMSGMATTEILAIPGVYEIMCEELNNEVIALLTEPEPEPEED